MPKSFYINARAVFEKIILTNCDIHLAESIFQTHSSCQTQKSVDSATTIKNQYS
ncbi:MAG: DUF6783 domain-containing protein [Blautia wexlerae]